MGLICITGANRGIGLELVRQYRDRGDTVVAACRKRSKGLEKLDVEVVEGVEVTDDKIVIREQVQFDYNRATIRKVSFDLLAEVAKVMNDNPRIKKIRVEGHASEEGSDEYNLALSKRRAFAVRDHLVKRGKVKASRLTHEGYGESRPIASNADEEGRSKNRRVEFVILEQDYVETKKVTDPNTGETQVTTTNKSAAE